MPNYKARFKKYQMRFKSPAKTSRAEMKVKNGYYFYLTDYLGNTAVGECSFIEGLSIDGLKNYEAKLQEACDAAANGILEWGVNLEGYPSIKFGVETALLQIQNGGGHVLYPGNFTDGNEEIPINGLVWMGNKEFMLQQITEKVKQGFKCIKLKVGAIDFDAELSLLQFIRESFPEDVMELRLDANGAFNRENVMEKLEALAAFKIHSIEQPVRQGQYELMTEVCASGIMPIALDEELIQHTGISKKDLLAQIKPQYIILKPSLLGGFAVCNEWINLATKADIGWWSTSALESNVGLSAIAQWAYHTGNKMIQGLGTGSLYTNNVSSPLYIDKGHLGYNPKKQWGPV